MLDQFILVTAGLCLVAHLQHIKLCKKIIKGLAYLPQGTALRQRRGYALKRGIAQSLFSSGLFSFRLQLLNNPRTNSIRAFGSIG